MQVQDVRVGQIPPREEERRKRKQGDRVRCPLMDDRGWAVDRFDPGPEGPVPTRDRDPYAGTGTTSPTPS